MKRPTERNGLKIVTYIVLIVATFISLFDSWEEICRITDEQVVLE